MFARSDLLCSIDVRKLRNSLSLFFTPEFCEYFSTSVCQDIRRFLDNYITSANIRASNFDIG